MITIQWIVEQGMDDSSVYKPTLQTMYQDFKRVCVCLCVSNEVGGSVVKLGGLELKLLAHIVSR